MLNKISLLSLLFFAFLFPASSMAEVKTYPALTLSSDASSLASIGIDKKATTTALANLTAEGNEEVSASDLYIAKLTKNTYLFIITSSLYCGTAGCTGYIMTKDKTGKLTFANKDKGAFFCDQNNSSSSCYYHVEAYDFFKLNSSSLEKLGISDVVEISDFLPSEYNSKYIAESSTGGYLLLDYNKDCQGEGLSCNVYALQKNKDGTFTILPNSYPDMICEVSSDNPEDAVFCMTRSRYEEYLYSGREKTISDSPLLWQK